MLSKNTLFTIITKSGILLLNFALVVFSTRLWGSQGRGEIALIIANISIITIFSNVFCGSTVAYHASRFRRGSLMSLSFTGAIFVSLAGAVVFSLLFKSGSFLPLFLIALFLSLTNSVSSWWLGRNDINKYNLLTLLNPLLILVVLVILYFLCNQTSLNTYFTAYCTGLGLVFLYGIYGLFRNNWIETSEIAPADTKSILTYGLNNEFNYLIQFLNYRLSYYFIATILSLSSLGLFSIVVSISEAVWIISRSMSAVHFSNVINSDDQLKNKNETIAFAKQSLVISVVILLAGILIPDHIYQLVFGNDFTGIRKLLLYMAPGIVAIAVSNLYGHYFAGTGKLKILRNKSLLGLAVSLILLPLLTKKYQLTGACISMDVSYIVSSFYLWYVFYKELKPEYFHVSAKSKT
jgi:O-antigen/teichoic acid export membrane protein